VDRWWRLVKNCDDKSGEESKIWKCLRNLDVRREGREREGAKAREANGGGK
jgi:hypothetical protein